MAMSRRRRRSPFWIRQMTSQDLHALALAVRNRQQHRDLTLKECWLFDTIISELEYRARNWKTGWRWCTCELCTPPPRV